MDISENLFCRVCEKEERIVDLKFGVDANNNNVTKHAARDGNCFGGVNKRMLNRFGMQNASLPLTPILSPHLALPSSSAMPRKAAVPAGEAGDSAAPRRSTRIKEQPKAEPAPKKAPAKPRAKKAAKEEGDKDEKPKSAKATKRKAPEEPNGAEEGEGEPAAKKVRPRSLWRIRAGTLRHLPLFVRPSPLPRLLNLLRLNLPPRLLRSPPPRHP